MHTYNDINLNFLKHPSTEDVVRKYDLDAIRTSVRNILNTKRGEKLFKPDFGADLYGLLFEPLSPPTRLMARRKVVEAIARWEPRVIVEDVQMNMDEPEFGTLIITVYFSLVENRAIEDKVTIRMERIR
jgi:phage baseplate assembly protein W